MTDEALREALRDISALVTSTVLLPDVLPMLAAQLLVEGADGRALRDLAGLDLGPWDPRDAVDVQEEVDREAMVDRQAPGEWSVRALSIVATAFVEGRLSLASVLRSIDRIVVSADYPMDSEASRMFAWSDELIGGWGRDAEALGRDVKLEAIRLASGRLRPWPSILDAVGD